MLLLSSASIHTLSLQGRLRLQALIERDQSADLLRSAAQAFTTAASGRQGPVDCENCVVDWRLKVLRTLSISPFCGVNEYRVLVKT